MLGGFIVVSALAVSAPALAQGYRLTETDGTVHVTNVPPAAVPPAPPPKAAGVQATALALRTTTGLDDVSIHVRDAADRYGLPERLIHAVIRVESAYNPRAVSPKGARGLMQLMPGTAALLGVRDSFNPSENIDGGVRHLRGLVDRLGDLALALAAYNAGERAVAQYGGIPPYPETQGYVARILRLVGGEPVVAATTSRVAGEAEAEAEAEPPRSELFRREAPDGALVYTNIPARRR